MSRALGGAVESLRERRLGEDPCGVEPLGQPKGGPAGDLPRARYRRGGGLLGSAVGVGGRVPTRR